MLAAGRTFNAWFKELGWAPGDITRINQGALPGTEKLKLLGRLEGVDLSWLLWGEGTPYNVRYCLTRQQAEATIAELDGSSETWTRYFFRIDTDITVLLWTRPELLPEAEGRSFQQLHIIVPFGLSLTAMAYLKGTDVTERISLVERIQASEGWLGLHQLQRYGIVPTGSSKATEVSGTYAEPDHMEQQRLRFELLQEIEPLQAKDLQFVLDIVRRLIK